MPFWLRQWKELNDFCSNSNLRGGSTCRNLSHCHLFITAAFPASSGREATMMVKAFDASTHLLPIMWWRMRRQQLRALLTCPSSLPSGMNKERQGKSGAVVTHFLIRKDHHCYLCISLSANWLVLFLFLAMQDCSEIALSKCIRIRKLRDGEMGWCSLFHITTYFISNHTVAGKDTDKETEVR